MHYWFAFQIQLEGSLQTQQLVALEASSGPRRSASELHSWLTPNTHHLPCVILLLSGVWETRLVHEFRAWWSEQRSRTPGPFGFSMISWSAAETSYLPSDRITCVEYYPLGATNNWAFSFIKLCLLLLWLVKLCPNSPAKQKSNLLISILFLINFEPLLPLSQSLTQNDKLSLMPKFYSRDVWKTRYTKQNSTHTLQNLVTFRKMFKVLFPNLANFSQK